MKHLKSIAGKTLGILALSLMMYSPAHAATTNPVCDFYLNVATAYVYSIPWIGTIYADAFVKCTMANPYAPASNDGSPGGGNGGGPGDGGDGGGSAGDGGL